MTVEELTRELYDTLHERLADSPDDTLVLPGHRSLGTEPRDDGAFAADLGVLHAELAAFRGSEATFVERVTGDTSPQPANYERIVAINLGRETADDETAFELELGPNNCAVTADRESPSRRVSPASVRAHRYRRFVGDTSPLKRRSLRPALPPTAASSPPV